MIQLGMLMLMHTKVASDETNQARRVWSECQQGSGQKELRYRDETRRHLGTDVI